MSFYVSTATFFLLHCDEWDRVVALPRHKFVTGATLLQLGKIKTFCLEFWTDINDLSEMCVTPPHSIQNALYLLLVGKRINWKLSMTFRSWIENEKVSDYRLLRVFFIYSCIAFDNLPWLQVSLNPEFWSNFFTG